MSKNDTITFNKKDVEGLITLPIIGTIGCMGCGFYLALVAIATKMFEYSLWIWVGKDVPWYVDLLGALVLNGLNFIIFVISLITSFITHTPVYHLS